MVYSVSYAAPETNEQDAIAQIKYVLEDNPEWLLITNVGMALADLNEIDGILYGKRGFVCLEFKNWSGTIDGSISGDWMSIDKFGVPRKEKSPLEQANKATTKLRNYLQKSGLRSADLYITYMVVITDQEAVLKYIDAEVCDLAVDILRVKDGLERHLLRFHQSARFKPYNRLHLNRILTALRLPRNEIKDALEYFFPTNAASVTQKNTNIDDSPNINSTSDADQNRNSKDLQEKRYETPTKPTHETGVETGTKIDPTDSEKFLWTGLSFAKGDGRPQDFIQARKYFVKAANLGNAYAIYNLGVIHENGFDVKIDLKAARAFYKRAAILGDLKACAAYGAFLRFGIAGERDYKNAFYYLEKATHDFDEPDDAMVALGSLLRKGRGTSVDVDASLSLYRNAAKLGNKKAKRLLAAYQSIERRAEAAKRAAAERARRQQEEAARQAEAERARRQQEEAARQAEAERARRQQEEAAKRAEAERARRQQEEAAKRAENAALAAQQAKNDRLRATAFEELSRHPNSIPERQRLKKLLLDNSAGISQSDYKNLVDLIDKNIDDATLQVYEAIKRAKIRLNPIYHESLKKLLSLRNDPIAISVGLTNNLSKEIEDRLQDDPVEGRKIIDQILVKMELERKRASLTEEKKIELRRKSDESATLLATAVNYSNSNQKIAAVRHFEKSAELGNPTAMLMLGHIYREGDGVDRDFDTAVVWYTKALSAGHPQANSGLNLVKIAVKAAENSINAVTEEKNAALSSNSSNTLSENLVITPSIISPPKKSAPKIDILRRDFDHNWADNVVDWQYIGLSQTHTHIRFIKKVVFLGVTFGLFSDGSLFHPKGNKITIFRNTKQMDRFLTGSINIFGERFVREDVYNTSHNYGMLVGAFVVKSRRYLAFYDKDYASYLVEQKINYFRSKNELEERFSR